MKGSLLTIGDELLIGQVLNSNVKWMSERLTEINCTVQKHLTVGDLRPQVFKALDYLCTDSDFIIIGGGLGPTHDDLTMEALSEYFHIPLEFDAEWIGKVEAFFKARQRVMSENNKKQGFLLKTAIRIDNPVGTAAGQCFTATRHGKSIEIFVVPGVPHEMQSMMEKFILPRLAGKTLVAGEKIMRTTLLTTGIGESALAEKCSAFVKRIQATPEYSLAFLPSSIQVRLRLQTTVKTAEEEKQFQQWVNDLKDCCGKDFFGFDPLTLEEWVIDHCKKNGHTLSLAESCTGGLVTRLLTRVPGSSEALRGTLVPYQTALKTSELGISSAFLEEYGVVSEKTAVAMAESIRKKWNTTFGLATTGYVGPSGGDPFAKLGTVWIAVATPQGTFTKSLHLENHRERNQERSAQAALDLLRRHY